LIENPEPVPPRFDAEAERESPTVYPIPGLTICTAVTGPLFTLAALTATENPEPPPGRVAERVLPEVYPLHGLVIVTVVTALLIEATGTSNPEPAPMSKVERMSPTAYPLPPLVALFSVTALTLPVALTVMFTTAPLPVPVTSVKVTPV
jgi:hypothetical protein